MVPGKEPITGPRLGERNPDISYVRYSTSSAFRKAGAFLPQSVLRKEVYEYRLSPYMGCPKRCVYCFELHNEFIESDQVKIKVNTVPFLRKTLPKISRSKAVLVDGYDCEEIEKEEKVLQSSLEVLLEHGMPVLVQTKSDLVLRDLDLLKELHDSGAFVHVTFSMSTLDRDMARVFEPFTCRPRDRLKAMSRVASEGIPTGIILMPILPYISDGEDVLDPLFSEAASKGCGYIIPESLRLVGRGPQRDLFMKVLEKVHPSLVGRYRRLYPPGVSSSQFGSVPLNPDYHRELGTCLEALSKRHGIPLELPTGDLKGGRVRSGGRSRFRAGSAHQTDLDSFL